MIDQLRRKKFLENLSGRTPAEVPSVEDEALAMEKMDIAGEYRDDPSLIDEADSALSDTVKVDRAREKSDNISGDLMVGASHALLGLLSGNHNRAAMEYGKGNKYVQDRAKEDIITSKDLVKTNQNGKAIYTPAKEAVDMEAYIPAKGINGGSSGRDNDTFNVFEPDTGKSYGVIFNKREGKFKSNSGNDVSIPDNAVVRPFANKVFKTEDVQGNVTESAYNQHAKSPVAPIAKVAGLGKHYGVQTKGQAEQIEKGIGKGQEEAQSISGAIVGIDSVIETLRTTKSPRAFSAAVYQGAREVEPKGVFTEQDYQVISGGSFMPSIDQLNEFISKKGTGNLDTLRQSYIDLFKDVRGRLGKKRDSIPSRFAPNTKPAQDAVNKVIPKAKQSKMKNMAEWRQAKSAAEKRWGKDGLNKPDLLEKYLQQKKDQLGIE